MFTALPEPVKAPLDRRSYRPGILANKLKVILVNDPITEQAGVSIHVPVGQFNDPEDLPGLSHFVEHLAFLGTQKYPAKGEYQNFLTAHGGGHNAATSLDSTNYHFSLTIPKKAQESSAESPLPQALDYFAQFFISPLFTESATDLELHAVNNEFENALQADGRRIWEVEKQFYNPDHPIARFGMGNTKSLKEIPAEKGIDVRAACLAHHAKYYSANLMTLAIVSPHSLDEMQEWAVKFFEPIENKERPRPSLEYENIPIFTSKQLGRKISVSTVKDIRQLELTWALKPIQHFYKEKPWRLIDRMIGHEAEGSLFSVLKARGIVNSLYAGRSALVSTPCQEMFSITLDLTKAGVEQMDEVLRTIFGYIKLCETGIHEWLHEEIKAMSTTHFRYSEPGSPHGRACFLSSTMQVHYLDPQDLLRGGFMMESFEEVMVRDVLSQLTPENVNLLVAGQFLQKDATPCVEPWFGTSYGIENIPPETLSTWGSTKLEGSEYFTPKPNPYIPKNLDLIVPPIPIGEQDEMPPVKLEGPDHFEVFYKVDKQFRRPYASVSIDLQTPLVCETVEKDMICDLFMYLVSDDLSEFEYLAASAGMYYSVGGTSTGFYMAFSGYNDKLNILIENVLDRLISFSTKPDRLEIFLDQTRRGLANYLKSSPLQIAAAEASVLTRIPSWSNEDARQCLDAGKISKAAIDRFAVEVLKTLKVKMFVHGNVKEDWVRQVSGNVQAKIGFSPLHPSLVPDGRMVQIQPSFEVLLCQKCPNPEETNSGTQLTYQIGPMYGEEDMKSSITLRFLVDILYDPLFNEIRTNQQLGYIAGVQKSIGKGIGCLEIDVQGTEASPEKVCHSIEAYLAEFRSTVLSNLTDDDLAPHVDTYVTRALQPDTTTGERSQRLWGEIDTEYLLFDRYQIEAKVAREVNVGDIAEMFDEFVARGGARRRRITSLVYGTAHAMPNEEEVVRAVSEASGEREVRLVRPDAAACFKRAMPLWPAVGNHDPFVSIQAE